jgi:hypothetical protein
MEPILRVDKPYKANEKTRQYNYHKYVHTFPHLFLWYSIVLILLLLWAYAAHGFSGSWLDFHSGNAWIIAGQTLLILVLFAIPYELSLRPWSADEFVLRPSARSSILPAYRFLRFQYRIFVGCLLCTLVIELFIKRTPPQSLLIAFFAIFTLLSVWPDMRAWRWQRGEHKVRSSLADLTQYYQEDQHS